MKKYTYWEYTNESTPTIRINGLHNIVRYKVYLQKINCISMYEKKVMENGILKITIYKDNTRLWMLRVF